MHWVTLRRKSKLDFEAPMCHFYFFCISQNAGMYDGFALPKKLLGPPRVRPI